MFSLAPSLFASSALRRVQCAPVRPRVTPLASPSSASSLFGGFTSQFRQYAKKSKGTDLDAYRNIGISAHIDSGKTTLTERILYYTGKIDEVHDVRGKDGVGAKMDNMDLEREKGITIKSAATFVTWKHNFINIIDTPGHVDFTVEVERSLHVLDGAILVLCGVSGVQSQTMTVDRQMRRYNVPRIVFVNKLDRLGADPWKALRGLRSKLNINVEAVQIPIGLQSNHNGVVDLIKMKAIYFEGKVGDEVVEEDIPSRLELQAKEKREELINSLAEVDETLMELVMEEKELTEDDLHAAIRRAVIARVFVPLFMGSAYKNKGVQPLIDAVSKYLPSPIERQYLAYDVKDEGKQIEMKPDPKGSLVAYAFKLEENAHGQLTWIRVFRGTLKKNMFIHNVQVNQKVKVTRLARMHAGELEDVSEIKAGDIGAIFGIDCASGESFTDGEQHVQMNSMHIPEPVISLAITIKAAQQAQALGKALKRFSREDPTFRVEKDNETGETLISGMGELHLEIYVERMRREYDLAVVVGRPRVAYRETILGGADFNHILKKQTGGAGQFAHIIGSIEKIEEDEGMVREFVNRVPGNNISPNYIPSVEKGFVDMMEQGPLIGHPVEFVRFTLDDGAQHEVDSSDFSFRTCAKQAFTKAFMESSPALLEPVMSVDIEVPMEFQANVLSTLNKRRGHVNNATIEGSMVVVEAEVPLANMFSYSSELRSVSEGKGEFTMEYLTHKVVPPDRMQSVIADHKAAAARADERANLSRKKK